MTTDKQTLIGFAVLLVTIIGLQINACNQTVTKADLQAMEYRFNTRFDKVDKRLDKMEAKMDTNFNRLEDHFIEHLKHHNAKPDNPSIMI